MFQKLVSEIIINIFLVQDSFFSDSFFLCVNETAWQTGVLLYDWDA